MEGGKSRWPQVLLKELQGTEAFWGWTKSLTQGRTQQCTNWSALKIYTWNNIIGFVFMGKGAMGTGREEKERANYVIIV